MNHTTIIDSPIGPLTLVERDDALARLSFGAHGRSDELTPLLARAVSQLDAYFAGEFCNSYVLAKMKLLTSGRFLWTRTIGSTIVGEAVDSLIFYPLAFLGLWSNDLLLKVLVSNYLLKVGWEVVMTPLTYRVVNALKRAEHEDYYDRDTNFTPFSLSA